MRVASTFALGVITAAAAGGQMLVHTSSDGGGSAITGLGDLNADGHADFIVPRATSIAALSGVDRSVIWEIPTQTYDVMNNAGDVDGDGQDDLVVANWWESQTLQYQGVVRVYSGATQALLHEWFGPYSWSRFGIHAGPAGDVDADGFADVLVSAASDCCPAQANFVDVYSGANGTRLHHFVDPVSWSGFGYAIAAAGDVDADGFDDVVIGAPLWPGHAYVYSGSNGALLRDIVEASAVPTGFAAAVSGLGDFDSDGLDDIAVAAPNEPIAGSSPNTGRVYAFSGATGSLAWSSTKIWNGYSRAFGFYLELFGDVDGDGAKDLLAAAAQGGGWGPVDKLAVVSGRTGAIVFDAQLVGDALDIADLGDVNGDGFDDFGANGYPYQVGFLIYGVHLSNAPAPSHYCTAKTNSQGCLPIVYSYGAGPCLSVGDDLHVRAYDLVGGTNAALVWSLSQASTPFGGGTLCIGSTNTILAVLQSGHVGVACDGDFDFALRRSYLLNQGLTAGTTLYAQIVSRDPGFAPPNNFGLTDALAITIAP